MGLFCTIVFSWHSQVSYIKNIRLLTLGAWISNFTTVFFPLRLILGVPNREGSYRVFKEKLYFFHISLQPLPRLHRCKRPSTIMSMIMYSYSNWLVIFVQPIAAVCWQGRGGKLLIILGKKHNIQWKPFSFWVLSISGEASWS